MNPDRHWQTLPKHSTRSPLLVWLCALVWLAMSSFAVAGSFIDYSLTQGACPLQVARLLPGFLLSSPVAGALLASMAAALLGALVYSVRR